MSQDRGYNDRGGYDNHRRDRPDDRGYNNDRGSGYNDRGGRGNSDGNRYDRGGRGSGFSDRGPDQGANRGGYGDNRGGYGDNRGGYGDNRGGYGDNRGGFQQRGGYGDNRGGFQQRGGYGDNRGGFNNQRGGYGDNRGGFNNQRGGYNNQRGGFNPRGGFVPRGGGNPNARGGYNQGYNQGGFISDNNDPRGMKRARNDDQQSNSEGQNLPPAQHVPLPDGHKLFVVCSKRVPEDMLEEQFEGFGDMLACKLLRDQNGNSKGCGFVVYAKKKAAISAIEHMNGEIIHGQELKVMMAVDPKGVSGKPWQDGSSEFVTAEELDKSGIDVEEEEPETPQQIAEREARLSVAINEGVKMASTAQKEIEDRLSKSTATRQYDETEYDY